jgi:hypothetical protein
MKTPSTLLLILCLIAGIGPTAAQGTFTETQSLGCGDTAWVPNLGYPTWNEAKILQYPRWGYAQLAGEFIPANLLVYEAPPYFSGADTVIIECAHATQITCDTGIYIFNISCDTTAFANHVFEVPCNDTIYTRNLSGWGAPYITAGPDHGEATIILEPTDGAGVLYIPEPDFEGLDWVMVNSFGNLNLFIFHVNCQSTAVSGPAIQPLALYPNPATDRVWLPGISTQAQIKVLDIHGREICVSKTRYDGGVQLELSQVIPGIYSIFVVEKGINKIGRLIL